MVVLAIFTAMAGCHKNDVTQEVDAAAANGNLAPVSDTGGATQVNESVAPAPARQAPSVPPYPQQTQQPQYPAQGHNTRTNRNRISNIKAKSTVISRTRRTTKRPNMLLNLRLPYRNTSAPVPRTKLSVDAWLLVVCAGRLLLGSWSLGRGSLHGRAVDTRILGMPGVMDGITALGALHWLLWWCDYGNGYVGRGYYGGYWNHDKFNYNRRVTSINNTVIHNTYITNVTNITTYNRVSYSGGRGG